MIPKQLDDNEYTTVINQALDTAVAMMRINHSITARLTDNNNMLDNRMDFTINMIQNVKEKFNNGMQLNPGDSATISRAMNEYVQRLENAQSHAMYMVEDLNDLKGFKSEIMKVQVSQMRFQDEMVQDQANKAAVKMRQTPRP